MFYISFTSKDRRGEEVPLKARLVVWHLPLERTISRFPDFPTDEQKISRILCPNFGEYRFPGNSQIQSEPVKIFWVHLNPTPYFGQIPDPENTLPDIPVFRAFACNTHKKGENQGVIILVKLKLKYLLASLVFLYLKKKDFDIVNVSSPYIMMWDTVNESWFLVKYLVKIKKVIV